MVLAGLVFLGGMLTILSPCILPVLPFVFARAEQPFLKSGLPLLIGMALTFAAVATLAAVGGSWAVHINQYGRVIALALLAAFAMTLVASRCGLARPSVRRARQSSDPPGASILFQRRNSSLAAPRSGDRPAVGALRRTNPRLGTHRRCHFRSQRAYDTSALRVCGRLRALVSHCTVGGRSLVCCAETQPWSGRVDTARTWGSGIDRGHCNRFWLGQRCPHSAITRGYGTPRTIAHREANVRQVSGR